MKEEDIPVLKKYPGAGEYFKEYLGMTTTGVMLFVPESRVSYAKDLISKGLTFGRQLRRLQLIPESSVEGTHREAQLNIRYRKAQLMNRQGIVNTLLLTGRKTLR